MTSTEHADLGLLDPSVQADPYDLYRRLRAEAPVSRMPVTDFWLVTTYEDIRTVLTDPETFSNDIEMEQVAGAEACALARTYESHLREEGWGHVQTLQRTDPPVHGRYRRLVNRVFTPAAVRSMVPSVERVTDLLLDAFVDEGRCDWVADFAFPLPGIVIAEQLGLAPSEIRTFRRWADAMLAAAQGGLTTEAATLACADVELEAQHYLAELFDEKRRHPTDDLISTLVQARDEEGQPLSVDELQNLMHQLITGGYSTTADALSNAMLLLLQHPDQMQQLRADPTLVKSFVEEVLRFSSPVQGLFRRATRDVVLHGVAIREGEILHIRYAAANRDGAEFDRVDDFDITRSGHAHLAFGLGTHFCVGAPLARQEIAIGISRALERMDDIEPDFEGRPPHQPGLLFNSIAAMPLRFVPGRGR